jgi:uncharacterized protein involved in outer membrane biogenesis
MKRSRRRRYLLLTVAGVPLTFVVALILYLAFGDLGRHRGLVENLVTDALGRRLKIVGRFEPRLLSLTPSVVAEDVSLANPDWSIEPLMVHVDRLEGSIVLGSIFSGPIRIKDLRVDGVQVRLEVDGAGHASWNFDIPPSDGPRSDAKPGRPPIIFEQALLRDVEFSYRNLSSDGGIALDLGSAKLEPESSGAYQVAIDGHVNGTPFELAGRYGSVEQFILFKAAEYDLRGRLAETEFAIAGQMSNLQRLDHCDSTIDVHGPDVADLTETFGIPSLGVGPFTVIGKTVPGEDGTEVDLQASLGEVHAAAHGRVASLISIDELDLDVEGSGPSLKAFGALFGAGRLPAELFQVSGRVQRSGGRTVFEGVEARLGDHRLSVEGAVGKPPAMIGTDVKVTVSGGDLSMWSSVVDTRLPEGPYELRGRWVRDEDVVELHDVRLRVGEAELRADGSVTDPPRFSGSDLKVQASGPDLSAFSTLAGLQFPARSFEIEGSVKGGDERFRFESVRARLDRSVLSLEGSSPTLTKVDGVDVRVHVEGPDLAEILALAGLEDLPNDPFEVDGRIRVSGKRYALTDVSGSVGDLDVKLDGTIATIDGFVGTDVVLAASGRDLSRLGRYAEYDTLPADPYRVEGHLRVESEGYRLDAVEAEVGDISAKVAGLVGGRSGLDGSDLSIEVRGGRLSDIAAFGHLPELPAQPFSVVGRVAVAEGAYRLQPLSGALGANRIEIEGLLGPFPNLERSELSVKVTGPDLADVAEAVRTATEVELPDLPRESYEVSGHVRAIDRRYELTDVAIRLGQASLMAHGWVGAMPEFHGTDLTLDANGPTASSIGLIAGITLPDEPFRIAGRAEWDEAGARFHDLRAEVGSHSLRVDGALGRLPKLIGTALDLHSSGPEPDLIGQWVDLSRLPAEPYDVAAHFDGTPEEFTLRGFRARLGDSDLAGEVRVDLRGKPTVHGVLTSRQIDLRPLLPKKFADEIEELEGEEPKDRKASEEKTKRASGDDGKRRALSDEPFDFQILMDQDADIHLSIGSLTLQRSKLIDFELRLKLTDGHLQVDPVSMAGLSGGTLSATLDLEPLADSYRLETRLDLENARLELLSYGDDRQQWPPIDVHFDLSGQGRSQRELASGLTGYAVLDVGSGSLDPSILDLLAFDVVVELLEVLNPFRKEEKFTQMECAVFVARFEDGRATLEPLATQTDKLTIVGHGRINLENEKLDLSWNAKPRKGVGVSASAITNSYIKIGGTLGSPSLEVKPLRAVTATGAAVATAGLSLLASGMWDRITADKKVCKTASKLLDEIKKEIEAGGDE